MNPAVYDAGALVAADRNDRDTWADHRVRLEAGVVPRVPAPVVAQVSRSARQAQLRRFLRGCDVVAFDEQAAHEAGVLLRRARTSDVVDAAVVHLAIGDDADIVTSDRTDIERLLTAARVARRIVDV